LEPTSLGPEGLRDDIEQGGLAGAIRPDKRDDLTLVDRYIHFFKHAGTAIAEVQTSNIKQ